MATQTPSPTSLSLKLLIDPKSNTVLFAEAGKDFVDFLFNIMSFPVATIISLTSKQGTVGCTRNIYDSIENLDDSYMSAAKKESLLNPMVANYDANVARLLPTPQCSVQIILYRCVYKDSCRNVTNDPNTICDSCRPYSMSRNVTFVNPENKPLYSSGGGFVKGPATFMVTDDLVVRPMSSDSVLALFNKFNIKDISGVEVRVVGFGVDKGVELLRALMQTKTVLTDVFWFVLSDVLLAGKKEPFVEPETICSHLV